MDIGEGSRTLLERLEARGVSRREFLSVIAVAAASVGLPAGSINRIAEAATTKAKPSVVWLHLQECTGCTESLLRTSHPALEELILDLISLDYHETLSAAAGRQAEEVLDETIKKNAGKFVLVAEGAVPTKEGGAYCRVGGRTALELVRDVAGRAGAVVAIGSCASWGGVASADPNPTGARGVPEVLKGKTVVTLPGCPANPYNLLGTVLQYATFGTLPALDASGRPRFAYGRMIHEDCPRRPHFDAGRFVTKFGDEAHRNGYCLYKVGCKGPVTHANCPLKHFAEVDGAWPVAIGHPCIGCSEKATGFRVPLHQVVEIQRPTPPDTYAPIRTEHGGVSPVATGVAGLVGGALIGAGAVVARRLGKEKGKDEKSGKEE
jgi:hydrogenase small subunit